MIKVNNLSKEFHEQGTRNELLAVDHVDFTIQDGSFCALVGESGSGKMHFGSAYVRSAGPNLLERYCLRKKSLPSAGANKSRYCDLKYS